MNLRAFQWVFWQSLLGTTAANAATLGTAFNYQGRLLKDGTPVSDVCSFTFGLLDAAAGGNHKGNSPQGPMVVQVIDGLFRLDLDYGAGAVDGTARWLEVTVQCPGDPMPITLNPRTAVTPAPHALALPGLYTQQNATSANLIGGFPSNSVAGGAVGSTISGGGTNGALNQVNASYGAVSGGLGNATNGFAGALAGGSSNIVSDNYGTVGGGLDNQAGDNAGTASDRNYATVSGGNGNIASGRSASVPGGDLNTAAGEYSFAAGRRAKAMHDGSFVWADDTNDDFSSTALNQFLIRADGGVGIGMEGPGLSELDVNGDVVIGGGFRLPQSNTPNYDGTAEYLAITGQSAIWTLGVLNSASPQAGDFFISRGPVSGTPDGTFYIEQLGGEVGIGTNLPQASLHVFNGLDADLLGGGHLLLGSIDGLNLVIDNNEIIARNAAAASDLVLNNGSGQVAILRSSATHPLHVGTNNTNGNGAHLTAGGVWTNGSDRNSKEAFGPLNPADILARVVTLPVTHWRYQGEPESVRHIGPVAQDFYTAFGTGGDERYIGTIDADGVALAAIQGLHQIVQEKDCEIAELRARLDKVEQMLASQKDRGR